MIYKLIFFYKEKKMERLIEKVDRIPQIGEEVQITWTDGPSDILIVKNVRNFIVDVSTSKTIVCKKRPTEVYLEFQS